MLNNRAAYGYALTSVFFWSTAGTAFAITLRYFNPYQLLLFSSATSSALLALAFFFSGKRFSKNTLSSRNLASSAILGFLNPFGYYIILFWAYSLLPAQEAMVLNYFWPVVLVLLSVPLLKQRIGYISVISVFLSFSGLVTIALRGDFQQFSVKDPMGFALASGSSVVWALYWLLNMKDRREPTEKLMLNFAFGTLYILIASVLFSGPFPKNWQGYAGAAYIGMFEMGFTFLLWLNALKKSDTTARISNLVYISPFLSLIFIRIFIGEHITFSTFSGLILVIGGVFLQHYDHNRKNVV